MIQLPSEGVRDRRAPAPPAGAAHSVPRGDVVLCNLPPYSTQPWLATGLVVHHALLARAGIAARIVRPLPPPFVIPESVQHASHVTLLRDPPLSERLERLQAAQRETPEFFETLVEALASGGEHVVGLSVWRNNVDLSLFVARRLKELAPERLVILGGPEAIEEPEALRLPWIDAVLGVDAERTIAPLVEALLERRPARAAALPHVWLNPALGAGAPPLVRTAASPGARELPTIDYRPLMGLFLDDPQPTVPLLLNWGCPYTCTFCSNANMYPDFTAGGVERVLAEMDGVVEAWRALHGGLAPHLTLQLSDATANALPAQLDALLEGVAGRAARWGTRPKLRGQILLDTRLTEERLALMKAANFTTTFFGLESGSDRMRRLMKKPGSIAQVKAAMEAYHRSGLGGLHFGVPCGIPGETEDDFAETERVVEWALRLEGTIESITVLPYLFFLTAQDPALLAGNRGERRGILWRTDDPAGDPAARAHRYIRIFELADRHVRVNSPVPPYLALPAMLPDEDAARLEEWMTLHGRIFDQLAVPEGDGLDPSKKLPSFQAPAFAAAAEAARERLAEGSAVAGWRVELLDWLIDEGLVRGLVVVLGAEDQDTAFALLAEAPDASRPAFARTPAYNLSYLQEWRGRRCSFDAAVMNACVERLRAPVT